jgi:hypothetical protein
MIQRLNQNQIVRPGLDVNLDHATVIKSFPARTISADKIVIEHIIDYYTQKKVVAQTKSVLGQITLWEGDAYDTIGQWTDQDVIDRIKEIVG